ncbi:bifunctional diaminohydroxyphosphoribosylaminopyrimidine deaminase/5-amino-6-(5-phosphoribosylamino)uracil reductase RibD [Dethiothermospora halolimnae]|uniref:bifunctional diaminohydroxyphosphoribosylaminopyrimidine deaminase/5-amino-6-(5-phosphoribosylamino)uracil reductase RibD n=1 Tax=Dethiothermospora halolimnae TaxID=3114390 RepID=UPI003CCBFE6E
MIKIDKKYMKLAIELAKKGVGYVNPNPLVGAVIVKDGKIVGQGYHRAFGEDHAEVDAIKNSNGDITNSTMYVTLEPCSHYGKTPPCVNTIIKNGISKVVLAMKDPNPMVSGRGINILRESGVEVIVGVLEEEARRLNEVFIKYITKNKPFVILKTAMTLDGKIATTIGDSKWISNEKSRYYVHKLRHKVSVIMVGINTIIKDNPKLTTRLNEIEGKDPIRVIVDSKGRVPISSNILNIKSNSKTIIATTDKMDKNKVKEIEAKGGEVIVTPATDNKVDIKYLIKKLGQQGIDSILLEGGGTLNYSCLNEGVVDKVISFISPKIIGGSEAKTPIEGEGKDYIRDSFKLRDISVSRFDEDIMIEGYI